MLVHAREIHSEWEKGGRITPAMEGTYGWHVALDRITLRGFPLSVMAADFRSSQNSANDKKHGVSLSVSDMATVDSFGSNVQVCRVYSYLFPCSC